ncbi:hypothetical protein DFJ74DRAFT_493618 [Hyaloraphidium curvatum]|nr:hypothetical protein DFJ74DRAFT_493618 [Hyaloraphidium curvatum]
MATADPGAPPLAPRRGPRPLPPTFRTTPSLSYGDIAASSSGTAADVSATPTPVLAAAGAAYAPQRPSVDTAYFRSPSAPSLPSVVTPDYRDLVKPAGGASLGSTPRSVAQTPAGYAGSAQPTPVWSPAPADPRSLTMVDAGNIRDEFNKRRAAADRPQSEVYGPGTYGRRPESDEDLARRLQEQERRAAGMQYASNPSLPVSMSSSIQPTPVSNQPSGAFIPPRVSSRTALERMQQDILRKADSFADPRTAQSSPNLSVQGEADRARPPPVDRTSSAQSFSSVNSDSSVSVAGLNTLAATELARRPTFAPPKPKPPRIITQINNQQFYEPEPAYQRQAPPPRAAVPVVPVAVPVVVVQQEVLHRPPPGPNAAPPNPEPAQTVAAAKGQRLDWKQTLDLYRANAKKTDNPKIQLEFAKFLIETAQALAGETPADRQEKDVLLDEGFRWLKKLATSAYPEAQYFLGTQYAQDGEYDKGFALWLQASKHNHPGACYEAGRCYELGLGTKKDSRRAQQFYLKSASAGYVPAMYRLGVASLNGECGFRKDAKEAVKWLKRGSAAGDAQSSYTLSGIYETGAPPSIYADESYAKSLLEEAAEKGWAPAQAKLAVCYEYGKLTCEVAPAQAIRWAKLGAEQGHPEAQFTLAGWYLTGADGVLAQSNRDALWWALKAAEQGLPKAEYAVGYFYETGIGAPPELTLATQWYQTAAAHGEKRAVQRLSGQNPAPLLRSDTVTQAVKAVRKQNDSDCSLM